ncbi:MAG: hypothetical protein ABSB12_02910 [Candidatus Saccharimonadales bacterium]
MSRPEDFAVPEPESAPIRPEELKSSDYNSPAEHQLAIEDATRIFNRYIRHKVYELLGGYAQGIDLVLQATGAYQTQAEDAGLRYHTNRQAIYEISEELNAGGHIKVKPTKGQVLQVLRWSSSDDSKRHEVVREITDNEEFVGRYLRWSETDKAAELLSWPLTSNNPTEWVLLRPDSDTGKNYQIVEIDIPQPS